MTSNSTDSGPHLATKKIENVPRVKLEMIKKYKNAIDKAVKAKAKTTKK